MRRIDLVGKRYGTVTVVKRMSPHGTVADKVKWECHCEVCGSTFSRVSKAIRRGLETPCFRCARVAEFWERVDRRASDECWEWTSTKEPNGYGKFALCGTYYMAHRLSYMLTHGDIPDGLLACHRCDNPPCVNPSHIFLGTHDDNSKDMVAKGRSSRGRVVPHEKKQLGERCSSAKLTREQVMEIRNGFPGGEVKAYALRIAPAYGIHFEYVRNILNRKTWAWL